MKDSPNNKKSERVYIAYAALRRAILDRALEPGDRLPSEMIGSGFGMSRTLAREVLFKLEGVGLVEIRPKRGAIVACPSYSEVQDVFEVRQCLENKSLTLVSEKWTPEFGHKLEKLVEDEMAAAKKGNLKDSIQLADEFHIQLGKMSGNKILAQYLEEIVSRCSLMLSLYGRPYSTECSIPEHQTILDALKKGDKSKTLSVMHNHIIAIQKCADSDEDVSSKLTLNQVINHYS